MSMSEPPIRLERRQPSTQDAMRSVQECGSENLRSNLHFQASVLCHKAASRSTYPNSSGESGMGRSRQLIWLPKRFQCFSNVQSLKTPPGLNIRYRSAQVILSSSCGTCRRMSIPPIRQVGVSSVYSRSRAESWSLIMVLASCSKTMLGFSKSMLRSVKRLRR
jgi:hypothetical protein